jgi:hypothetical protein
MIENSEMLLLGGDRLRKSELRLEFAGRIVSFSNGQAPRP